MGGRGRASVVAVRETTLKFLSRATFEEFAREHPEVYKNLVKVLATSPVGDSFAAN
jgi:CRP-like cAMP-binding protein